MTYDLYINPGEYRQVLEIEQPFSGRDKTNAITQAPWMPFATVRGKITPVSGRESLAGGAFVTETSHEVEIRYLPGLTTRMRINVRTDQQRAQNVDGRIFDILDVIDVEERRIKHMMSCRESKRGKSGSS